MDMKRQKIFLVLLLALVGLLLNITFVMAMPPLPSSFYGAVKENGENVPVGAFVTAWINGVQYAYSTTQLYQGDTVYSLDIPGDDASTPAIEGGIPGDVVTFKINGLDTPETGVWQSGKNVMLDLTSISITSIYLPLNFK
jgi:hypothetical protein